MPVVLRIYYKQLLKSIMHVELTEISVTLFGWIIAIKLKLLIEMSMIL